MKLNSKKGKYFQYLRKSFLVMRITLFFILLGTAFAFSSNSYAQNTKLSLQMNNAMVKDVLKAIEDQSEFIFFYQDQQIDLNRKVNIVVEDKNVSEILDQLFAGTENIYIIRDRQVTIGKSQKQLENIGLASESISGESQQSQKKEISGSVKDSKGLPLPGVSIVVKGTTTGIVTDADGKFRISVPADAKTLVFSFIGMKTQEIVIGNNATINVTLDEEIVGIEEVVAVGYGSMKKANLSGAISSVFKEVFESRAITNAAQALEGKVANLNVINSGGAPGSKPNLNIRGYSGLSNDYNYATFSPLVIVDGVTGSLDDINPSDIETLTVLKDAAASAIYGAQAAYGVILVTTKSGKRNQAPKVMYTNNFSMNNFTAIPKSAGSLPFAKLANEASQNSGGGILFDDETMSRIEQYYYHPGSIPVTVPKLKNPNAWSDWGDRRSNANTDFFKEFFKTQMNQTHNLSVTGGSENSTYMMSMGYTRNEGKLNFFDDKYSRYNVAAKLTSDVTKWLRLGMNIRYAREKTVTPLLRDWIATNYYLDYLYRMYPVIPLYCPNGHLSSASALDYLEQSQPSTTYTDNLWWTGTALFEILPGLTANIDFTCNKYASKMSESRGLVYTYLVDNTPKLLSDQSQTQVWQESHNDDYYTSNVYATYEKEVNGHSFKIMAGGQMENKDLYGLSATNKKLIIPDKPSLSTATGIVEADDALDHWSTLGYFGRFNYNYKEKYLFEMNVRRDGSSRYGDKSLTLGYKGKWGTFPSFSAGWNIAKEGFFASLSNAFRELKLRGSWGELGNMRGKAYQYVSTIDYDATYGYIMNGSQISAFGTPSLIAYNTWEKNRTLDFGLDFTSLKNRLTGSFDWYQKDIIGLITKGVTLPAVLGASSPDTNNADLRNTGFELTLSWKDRMNVKGKALSYNVYATLSDYQGKVMKYSNPKEIIGSWTGLSQYVENNFYEGAKMGQIWGYTTDHIMVDAAEAQQVNTSGSQSQMWGSWSQGDMKYKDLNGDGKINYGSMTLKDHGDLSIIGNSTPRYNYGFGLNAEWNGFDISVFFQGVGKRQVWLGGGLSGVAAWG